MPFVKHQINLTKSQKKKMGKAIETNTPLKLRLSKAQLINKGTIPMLMTMSQINKIKKSIKKGSGMMLNVTSSQIRANKKEGGIIPFLIPLVPLAVAGVSALATGALGALGALAVNKIADAFDKDKGEGLKPLGGGIAPFGTGLLPLGRNTNPVELGGNIMMQGLPPVSTPNDISMMPIGGQIIQPQITIGGQIIQPEISIGGQCPCGRLVGNGLFPIGTRTLKGSGLFPHGVPSSRGGGLAPFGTKP